MTALAPGASFAGYRIESIIGRGGMGVVYRATDLSLERPVALKLVAPELAEDERFRGRFLKEPRIAASLDHPNVVPIHEAGEQDGRLYLAMRFVDGSDLRTLIQREGSLSVDRALRILGQIADALDAAHRRGLVHRDVKPGNVLLDEDGHAYLTDFGITKQVGSDLTQTGEIVGTLDYLAPEQIRSEAVDGRTDVYALACVLYECLAGVPPFRRDTPAEAIWAHLQEPPPPLPGHQELDPVLATGLAKEREKRYLTCTALIEAARAPRAAATVTLGARGERRLPVPPNRTIGRQHDLDAIEGRLRTGSVRLLTLTGPGGVGKTRLALEAAREVEQDFADGGCFVSLAALQRPDDVPAAIVTALGTIVLSGESPVQALERFLAAKHLLLVMDNFEHVLGAAPVLGGLLEVCPALTVLATSREPLALHAEERYAVSPLELAELGFLDDPEALARVDAVALFCERARAHDPDFDLADADPAVVAEICRRLDGLPLAIELAAARCGVLSAGEIAERLRAALGALGAGPRDAPARQQTLRATIDWSHNLLDDTERECFARFAVFAGGATIEAAETVTHASLDTLDHLVAKSLLLRGHEARAPTRLRMLETIRAYATERFALTSDNDAVRERHYRHFLALAERHGSEQALCGPNARTEFARLDAEIHNLHAALDWATGQDSAEPALQLCATLGDYWLMRDRYADAVRWIDAALTKPGARALPEQHVRALIVKAWALLLLGRGAQQSAVMTEAESIARALGDHAVLSRVLQERAGQEAGADHAMIAESFADEAVHWANASQDQWTIAMAAFAKAMAADSRSALRERVDHASSLLTEAGNLYWLADLLASSAYTALCLGADSDASHFISRASPLMSKLDNPYLRVLLCGNLGLTALLTDDAARAEQAFRDELVFSSERVFVTFAHEGLCGLAAVATVRGDLDRAARLNGAAEAHRYGQPADRVDARLEEIFLEPARQRYGADRWDASVREGSALSFDDAIAYALQEPRA